MKQIKVTLVRSTINRGERHKRTVEALGLRKMNSSRVHNATPQVLGMVRQVGYLLKVEDVES